MIFSKQLLNAVTVLSILAPSFLASMSIGIDEQSVYLSPLLNSSLKEAIEEAGCLPVFIDISKKEIEEIYSSFIRTEDFDKNCQILNSWREEFASSEEAAPWRNTNYRFGIFGQTGPTHKKRRLIEGINCKISKEFCDWIATHHSEELATMPEVAYLFQRLMEVDKLCHAVFMEKIIEIAEQYPEIEKIFYSYQGEVRLPISIRIIRFDKTGNFCLPLHYDISILSLIFPSDDDPSEECLIIAPPNPTNFDVDTLRRAVRPIAKDPNQSCAILITGTMLQQIGIPLPPSPHGVLPHDRDYRYVITLCCHVPNLNTSDMNSVIADLKEVPSRFKKK